MGEKCANFNSSTSASTPLLHKKVCVYLVTPVFSLITEEIFFLLIRGDIFGMQFKA